MHLIGYCTENLLKGMLLYFATLSYKHTKNFNWLKIPECIKDFARNLRNK